MHYFKIILFLFLSALASCGKPPIFNKVEKNVMNVTGGIFLEEQFPNRTNSFSYKWIVAPTLSDVSSFELTLAKPLNANQTINAYLWMPEMGHGSSPIEIKQLSNTDYIFSELAFIMPGLWDLHIEILENNQVIESWQRSFTL
jgi:hypothetical protein